MPDLLTSQVVAIPDQVSVDLQGESAILNLRNGVYYSLNPVGASVWNQIQQPKVVSDVLESLLAEFDVEREPCQTDLVRLLGQLSEHGLIEVA